MYKYKKLFLALLFITHWVDAQPLTIKESITKQDTLRGYNTEYRNWWNVTHYDIVVEPDYFAGTLQGKVITTFTVEKENKGIMQIDLQEPLQIDEVELYDKAKKQSIKILKKDIQKVGNAYFINAKKYTKLKKGSSLQLIVIYSGMPRIAENAPWDGGWIFTTDSNRNLWMTVACQGLGASAWYPCKDYLGDEPDNGADLTIITSRDLKGVGNGRFVDEIDLEGMRKSYHWKVVNPINTYNIVPYIGDYIHFSDLYKGEKGELPLDYWVLPYNLEKAKKQFTQVNQMLEAFEYWFGPYPFYEDGYKLVESPHLGMEHQSDIAYGNKYINGYLGTDRSGSGVGMKWDFIIVHESGHEWFGNNITCKDIADMWIHEAFTTYSETLFTEYFYGKEDASKYIIGQRENIQNDIPIIGQYGVNQEGSSDMYDKGANMIHTIRQIINDDAKFRNILRGLNKDFYHQTVTTKQIEDYISKKSEIDFSKVFDQYLRTVKIPILEYSETKYGIKYRWTNVVKGFSMKIRTSLGFLEPEEEWKEISTNSHLQIIPDYYIILKKI